MLFLIFLLLWVLIGLVVYRLQTDINPVTNIVFWPVFVVIWFKKSFTAGLKSWFKYSIGIIKREWNGL